MVSSARRNCSATIDSSSSRRSTCARAVSYLYNTGNQLEDRMWRLESKHFVGSYEGKSVKRGPPDRKLTRIERSGSADGTAIEHPDRSIRVTLFTGDPRFTSSVTLLLTSIFAAASSWEQLVRT
eukprot:1061752-Prorocentrum_minimum.AAC.1